MRYRLARTASHIAARGQAVLVGWRVSEMGGWYRLSCVSSWGGAMRRLLVESVWVLAGAVLILALQS